jgi:hypothetical protein
LGRWLDDPFAGRLPGGGARPAGGDGGDREDIPATVTWYATNEWLDTIVYVQTNATLVIEPGR